MAEKQANKARGDILMGLQEIADFFGVTRWTIKNWIKDKSFPAAPMPNGQWAISVSLIDKWLLSRHIAGAVEANRAKELRDAREDLMKRLGM